MVVALAVLMEGTNFFVAHHQSDDDDACDDDDEYLMVTRMWNDFDGDRLLVLWSSRRVGRVLAPISSYVKPQRRVASVGLFPSSGFGSSEDGGGGGG